MTDLCGFATGSMYLLGAREYAVTSLTIHGLGGQKKKRF